MRFHSLSDHRVVAILAGIFLLLGSSHAPAAPDFEKQIQPILEGACLRCHNPEKTKGKLQLHIRAGALRGGTSGPAIVPGAPDDSEMIMRVSLPHDDDDIMPQEADPLSSPQLSMLREWIEAGAEWPEDVILRAKDRNEKTLAAAVAASLIPDDAPRNSAEAAHRADTILKAENREQAGLVYGQPIDDLAFLRRVTVDLIGRIPTMAEINQYRRWPSATRRQKLVDTLCDNPRFNERWSVFFADMLRIRSNADGGSQMLAYVYNAIAKEKPYDELVRELIASNGRSGKNPAVGFVLNDDADPMALAGATAQVFLGVRIQCAECHDHPFDDWKQKEFYELASFFGKTKRVQSRFAGSSYTTEGHEMSVQWPPEREKPESREVVQPKFPFELVKYSKKPAHIARLEKLRAPSAAVVAVAPGVNLDDLLDIDAGAAVGDGLSAAALLKEAKKESAALQVENDLYRPSELREKLAELITDPRNPYFARAFANRIWAELIGRGFVEPLDNFSDYNGIRNPQTMNFLAREFVASGYDLRSLVKIVVLTDSYGRSALDASATAKQRAAAETAFAAPPLRRMLAEVLFDSVVTAGHLEKQKWPAGANLRTVQRQIRVPIEEQGTGSRTPTTPTTPASLASLARKMAPSPAPGKAMRSTGYDLESGIGLDFAEILRKADAEATELEAMKEESDARIEARRMAAMMQERENRPMRYRLEILEEKIDDNPSFDSAIRMASPAPPAHFVRVFGQPSRDGLGEFRDHSASMRQALMMLNGKATHEAARVGPLEPLHAVMTRAGTKGDYSAAIRYAYLEILTREPNAAELGEARELLAATATPAEGMSDLRWALFNCHEFRFLP